MVPLKPLWYHQPLLFTIPSLSSDTPNVGEHLVSCLLQHFYCPHTLVHSFNCFLRSFSLSGTEGYGRSKTELVPRLKEPTVWWETQMLIK